MITREFLYVVECDTEGCHETHEWHPGFTRSYMIQVARDNGWGFLIRRGGKVEQVACPEHNDFDGEVY
jgi:hypothetical protein